MELFVALTSADGYKKTTSHLGPDPQVWAHMLTHSYSILNNAEFIGEQPVPGHPGT
jgi:hypothetical protein